MTHRIGYLIGSLAHDSINRVLATSLVQLAPPDLEMIATCPCTTAMTNSIPSLQSPSSRLPWRRRKVC